MKFNSIRFKIGVLHTSILGVILVGYSMILNITLSHNLYSVFDRELRFKAQGVINAFGSYLDNFDFNQSAVVFCAKRALNLEITHPEEEKIKNLEMLWLKQFEAMKLAQDHVNLFDSRGNLIASLKSMPWLESRQKKIYFKNLRFNGNYLRVINMPFSYKDRASFVIQVGSSLEPTTAFLKKRIYYRLVPIPAILLVGFFIGGIFVSRILKPIKEITEVAKSITYEDLTRRVSTGNIDEEMRYLAEAFNNMIARLERSFEYVSEFSIFVAHELKTPIAVIRGESEIALRKEREAGEYKRVVEASLEEAQRMLKIIEDLLFLTRIEYNRKGIIFERVDLAQFIKGIYEESRAMAGSKNIMVNIDVPDVPMEINGNKLHLGRLFLNLIDNAVKFSPQGSSIGIAVKRLGKEEAVVSFSDKGKGIAEKDIPKIFDKFFQADKQHSDSLLSSGLGLSIAQSIAKLHNGNISVTSELGKGSTFRVTFPLL